ncbi:unnamed protein product [Rotaria sp. Silwood1]|nr:unnamed protein product [Rotaria sp. Silwood1]CAF1508020.1 unnamed protein product [Rotaria sp. Silwood1]
MDNPTGTINSLYQYENIEDNILNKLEKLRQHYPERFPLLIHVLATVHDTIDGEWQQRLRQAMEQRNRVSIFLIPDQMSNFNWIVVIIKFKTDGQVERAEFIDPLRESNLDIDKLQIQFGEIYPGIILQPRSIRKQEDREKSIELTIETLLKLAEEYQTTNINDLHDKTIGDQNASDRLNKEKGSFPILTANGGDRKISPLNIHELFRLIKKVNSTVYTIKKKDIIFFLGLTGSGKSTTIHFLAGSKMIEIEVRGLYHIAPVEINNPDLKYITTSPFVKSETRYITSVEVKLKNTNGLTKESIILCDSPGFEDTSGPEVDIANGLGIVNVIKGCTSVKPVVVISYKSIRDQIEAFSYIFTKFPEKEKDTIHAFIKEIHRKLKDDETSDKSFMFLLEDILQKTRKGARVLDPINDKPETIN